MCRSLQVLCVAGGRPSLQALKRAAVAQEWELTPGATTMKEALDQLDERKPHATEVGVRRPTKPPRDR